MPFAKRLTGALAVVLFLLLALTSPGMAQESRSESLPVGATARLGRGTGTAVQYSPDGTQLAVGGSVGIWLYDVHTREVVSLFTGHAKPVTSVAFSPDGRTLASSSHDTVRLWDVAAGTLRHTLEGHTDGVDSVAFSPDGRTLASSSRDGTVLLWLWAVAAKDLLHILEGHANTTRSVAFSPDGQTLASGDRDGTISLMGCNHGHPPPHLGGPCGLGSWRGLQSGRAYPGQQW